MGKTYFKWNLITKYSIYVVQRNTINRNRFKIYVL